MTPISAEDMAELERMLEAATPGPWTWSNVGREKFALDGPQGHVIGVQLGAVYSEWTADPPSMDVPNESDSALIAAAPTAIRSLIARVRELQADKRSPSPAGEASEEAETLAVRAACQVLAESTEDLLCLFPDCDCEKVPNAVRAALAAAKGES